MHWFSPRRRQAMTGTAKERLDTLLEFAPAKGTQEERVWWFLKLVAWLRPGEPHAGGTGGVAGDRGAGGSFGQEAEAERLARPSPGNVRLRYFRAQVERHPAW